MHHHGALAYGPRGTCTYTGAGTYGHVEKIKVGGAVPANDCCYGSKTVNQYTRLQDRQPEHAAPRPQPEQGSLVCTGQ